MVETKNFVKMCRSRKIANAVIEECINGKENIIGVDHINVSKSRWIYFDDSDGKAVITPFKTKDIMYIFREKTDSDNDYVFLIFMKDDSIYRLRVFMKDNCTPFITDKNTLANYKAVTEAIPKHLEKLVGKSVIVNRASYSEMFSVYNELTDEDINPVTECFRIDYFDYETETKSGVPCIKVFDDENRNIYSMILNVSMITTDHSDNNNSIIISAETADYILKYTD